AFERVTVTSPAPPVGQYAVSATTSTTAFDGFAANDSDAATLVVATVAGESTSDLPRELTLASPWPNPARGPATVRWGLPGAAMVDVRVYDLLGREVARVADGAAEAGWHESRLDASALASGVYIVRLRAGDETRTRRITVLR
ncbi:MAG TPA: T9SS type A sorting domain-containing protein, partial [Rubricoccaceae bacterium]